jgi:hypothetical protein
VVTTKERDELAEKAKTLESILQKKERDITDLLIKVNDTINDYESKLEKKEEQMWTMSVCHPILKSIDSNERRNEQAKAVKQPCRRNQSGRL